MELTFHLIEDDADNKVTVSFLDCHGILGYADSLTEVLQRELMDRFISGRAYFMFNWCRTTEERWRSLPSSSHLSL